jgi:uncharacterized membrane protein
LGFECRDIQLITLQPTPDFLLFLGRLHPLLVHLPIGMIVALAALELAALLPRCKNANVSAGFLLALAAPLAVATALCGWLLARGGGYDAQLLAWHKWLGTATAAGAVLAGILYWRKKLPAYRICLFATAGVLMAAGHLGGSLTHGSDYLTEYAPAFVKKFLGGANGGKVAAPAFSGEVQQWPVFAGVIAPVLQKKCIACHGPEKSKAGLRLDSLAALKDGSDDGPVVQTGDAAHSPLVQRLLLPADNDDHMPPAGKPQATAAEIALLKWWVNAGLPETNTLGQLAPPPEILSALAGGK